MSTSALPSRRATVVVRMGENGFTNSCRRLARQEPDRSILNEEFDALRDEAFLGRHASTIAQRAQRTSPHRKDHFSRQSCVFRGIVITRIAIV